MYIIHIIHNENTLFLIELGISNVIKSASKATVISKVESRQGNQLSHSKAVNHPLALLTLDENKFNISVILTL